jgi:hypothetical protein
MNTLHREQIWRNYSELKIGVQNGLRISLKSCAGETVSGVEKYCTFIKIESNKGQGPSLKEGCC